MVRSGKGGKEERVNGRGALSRQLVLSLSLFLPLALSLTACDVVEPPTERLVVEAFIEVGEALPALTVRRTAGLADPDAAPPVADALVRLSLSGDEVLYDPVPGAPGRYAPRSARAAQPGDRLDLTVEWQGHRATATSGLPAPIALDSVRVVPAAAPVAAVFADSLGPDLREGFIYPVDVTLYWTAPPEDTAWVRTRLRPPAAFPSAVVDFLLATEAVQREAGLGTGDAVRRWSGVYAVPVEAASDPLPPHVLEVALLRSGETYARYALSRTDPGQREPVGNVEGGLGIVAGIALDRAAVQVE